VAWRVKCSGGDATAGDLIVGEQSPVKAGALLLCACHMGPVDLWDLRVSNSVVHGPGSPSII
jgi:hypothetical protein